LFSSHIARIAQMRPITTHVWPSVICVSVLDTPMRCAKRLNRLWCPLGTDSRDGFQELCGHSRSSLGEALVGDASFCQLLPNYFGHLLKYQPVRFSLATWSQVSSVQTRQCERAFTNFHVESQWHCSDFTLIHFWLRRWINRLLTYSFRTLHLSVACRLPCPGTTIHASIPADYARLYRWNSFRI